MSADTWAAVGALLSPALLQVVPPGHLVHACRTLSWSRAVDSCMYSSHVSASDFSGVVRVAELPEHAPYVPTRAQGESVLSLYFRQVFGCEPVMLDLRSGAFCSRGDMLFWRPMPLEARWSSDFTDACRDMYEGYFLGRAAQFSAGARGLGLAHAESALRAQFGDTRAVAFSAKSFVQRSTAVLAESMSVGASLHPDFVTLSLMLACMYEHLSRVAEPLDVRTAFERARR